MDAVIVKGALPESGLVDEANLLVRSLTITPQRTKRTFEGANGATFGIRYTNPLMVLAFSGWISTFAGLADAHPGSDVTDLANYEDAMHGFDPDEGTMVYEEPTRELDTENPAQVRFNVVQYPFVT